MYILITLLCFLVSYLLTSSLFSERESALSSYKDIECIVEGDIDNNINRNNPCHKKMIEERKVDEDKDYRQRNNTNQCLMLCHSCTHQLMMNMVLVGSEKRFAV